MGVPLDRIRCVKTYMFILIIERRNHMTKKESEQWSEMMADYLQYKFMKYKFAEKLVENGDHLNLDLIFQEYATVCTFLEAIGCSWKRFYNEEKDVYSHIVCFPNFKKLNFNAWKE